MRIRDWSSDVCSSDLSSWDDHVPRDFDRPLNKRGARAAATMGQYARSRDMHFDYLIASPALRVTETLDEFLEAYGQNVEANWDRRSEEHTSELQSIMRISYAVFCMKKKKQQQITQDRKTSKTNIDTE